jgi:AraC-like DNA-binding protein
MIHIGYDGKPDATQPKIFTWEEYAMLHIEQRLDLFQDMIGCCHNLYLWRYNAQMELLQSNCPEEHILNELFLLSSQMADLTQLLDSQDHPALMSNNLGLMWITSAQMTENELQRIYVLGPFFLYDVTASQIESELHRRKLLPEVRKHMMDFVRSLPVISLNRALEYAQMLHFCISGSKIFAGDIPFLGGQPDTPQEAELSTIHGTYEAEKEMIRLVREGDLDYKKHMKVIASTGRVGNIADGTALRQLKNMLIVNITLFSRAAMDGGLPPETGYTLSDRYLQAVEKSNSMKSLAEINTAMQDDFIQRVHQYRQNKDLSKPIRICVEQLQSRMEEPITLEDLAKDFGYSTYYLSKKFKAETGQAFKDYLRSIRLERAKFLLRSSELSILEISEKLQFCSASYFSDSFRKAYGISPSAYREQI